MLSSRASFHFDVHQTRYFGIPNGNRFHFCGVTYKSWRHGENSQGTEAVKRSGAKKNRNPNQLKKHKNPKTQKKNHTPKKKNPKTKIEKKKRSSSLGLWALPQLRNLYGNVI